MKDVSTYLNFCISIFPSFSPCHLVWYLEMEKGYGIETLSNDRVLNEEHFYGKNMQKIWTKS